MMAPEKRRLTIKEKIDYVPAMLSIGGSAVTAPLTGPFRGPDGADTYKHHIAHAIIRKFNSRLSSIQSQYFQPQFSHIYDKWCKTRGVVPQHITTRSGLKGFWIGDKDRAKNIIVYYHGGGFALDGSDGHLDFWHKIQNDLESSDVSTAFFYVLYTLTPHAIYPTQLKESIQAIRYVVQECRRRPSEILLAGDSAGGNLAVSALLHMTHPKPGIEPFNLKENFRGLILMAPWVSLDVTWPSFERNKGKDYLEAEVEGRWAEEYLKGQAHDEWSDPELAPSEWWTDARADNILVVVGSVEALHDGIESWVTKYRSVNPTITMEVGKDEVHIAPIVWPLFGDHHKTQQEKSIKQWMRKHLVFD